MLIATRRRPGDRDTSLFGPLPHEHERGLSFEIDVRLTADVDRHPADGATGEGVRRRARVVVGNGLRSSCPTSPEPGPP